MEEVLQAHQLYLNVSKGIVAKKEDLKKCFNTEDMEEAIMQVSIRIPIFANPYFVTIYVLQVLQKGDIQVSEKERQLMNEKLFRDIATIVAEKCVNPDTKRPLTVSIVEKAMKDMHFSVQEKRNAKQQALEVIKLLKGKIPIQRAQMKLKIVASSKEGKKLHAKLTPIPELLTEKEESTEEKLTLVRLSCTNQALTAVRSF